MSFDMHGRIEYIQVQVKCLVYVCCIEIVMEILR